MSWKLSLGNLCEQGLKVRIASAFLVFVIAGSVGLALWLQLNFRRESQELFVTLARTNADFIRSSRLPWSEKLAHDLSRILNVQVYFRGPGSEIIPSLREEAEKTASTIQSLSLKRGVARVGDYREAIAVQVDDGRDLILVRTAPEDFALLRRPATLLVLFVFWMLTLGLALALTREIVRPLQALTLALPHIEEDSQPSLPGAERHDEIGSLARTYLQTHAQLVDERQRREKAERLALLGKMTAGLAHEIHNPLSAIRMHLQLLESAGPSEIQAAAASAIPVALAETVRIESLVNQWMFLARPSPPETSVTELGGLVGGVVRSMEAMAKHARVSVIQEIPGDLQVNVDSRRMTQAIGNIVINAIQAMPGGGTLRITGRRDRCVVVSFEDSGRGFSEKALRVYDELFYSEKEGGMGIGLSVASEIVKAHGGALRVANASEGGAVVTIELGL